MVAPAPAATPKIPAMNFSSLKANAAKFGLSLAPKDVLKTHVKEKLLKFEIKDEDEITKVKELVESLKDSKSGKKPATGETATGSTEAKKDAKKDDENKENEEKNAAKEEVKGAPRRAGALPLDLFMKVKEIALCNKENTDTNSNLCINVLMVKREGKTIAGKVYEKWNKHEKKHGHDKDNQPYKKKDHFGRRQKTEQEIAMEKLAKKWKDDILDRKAQQKIENRIKLILNILSPDNFEKKIVELREFIFPNFKT